MSARILIVKNVQREGPGLLRDVLQAHRIGADVIELERGDRIPSLDDYAGLVVLGGPASANDATEVMQHELSVVKHALDANIPYLGICLGMQVLVKAAGGNVVRAPMKEVGFLDNDGRAYSVHLTEAGRNDPLFEGVGSELRVFQLHGESVELSGSVELLATAPGCPNQVVRVGRRAYGLQMHIEVVPEMLAVWAAQDPDLVDLDASMLQTEYAAIAEEYARNGRRVLANFLAIAGLTSTVDLTEGEVTYSVR